MSRRDVVKGAAGFASFTMLNAFTRMLPPPQQGEDVVPWTDIPANFNPAPALDTRTLRREAFITPTENFYLVQHYGIQQVDPATYRLRITGLVETPIELTLDELKRRKRVEEIVGFECGGSSPTSLNRLTGNARWAGTPLRDLLRDAKLRPDGREIVFYGADKGWSRSHTAARRSKSSSISAQSRARGRDAPRGDGRVGDERRAARGESRRAGASRRSRLVRRREREVDESYPRAGHAIRRPLHGARLRHAEWRTGRRRNDLERDVGRAHSREVDGGAADAIRKPDTTRWAFALAHALPLKAVEVRVDDGPWRKATLDSQNTRYSWQLFTYPIGELAAGNHTIVSRAIDANGVMQPEQSALDQKKTNWENNGQFVRKFTL
jgi:hypothetical protein